MRAKHSPNLLPLALLSALTILGGVAYARPDDKTKPPPADPSKAVYAFEASLKALPSKEDRIDATRKFFNGLKDSAAKIEAVSVFDDRYVYAVPEEAADEVLGKFLKDADLKVRVRAAHALGYLGKGGGHFDDLAALFKDADAEGMPGVLYAMGRSRDPRFLPYLRDALKRADLSVRQTAAFELTMYPAQDVRDDLAALLKDAEPVVRAAGVSTLSQLGDAADTPRILGMLNDPSEMVRARAVAALGNRGKSEETGKAVAALLADSVPSVQAAAAESLGRMKATTYRAAVEKLLDHKDVLVRRYAVKALGEMGDLSARPALEGKLKDEDYMVRSFSLEALAALGDKEAGKAAALSLADPQADVRRAAAEALMRLKAVESVPALLKVLDDPDNRVRWMAALAVGRLGDKSILPELRRRLEKAEGDLRDRLDQSIREIESR